MLERLWEVGKDKKLGRRSTRIPLASDLWVSCVVYLKTKSRKEQECGVSMLRITGGVHSYRCLSSPINSGVSLRHDSQAHRNAVGCCRHPALSQQGWCARSKCLKRASCIALLSSGQDIARPQTGHHSRVTSAHRPQQLRLANCPRCLPGTLEHSVNGHLTLPTPPECTLSALESLGSCSRAGIAID